MATAVVTSFCNITTPGGVARCTIEVPPAPLGYSCCANAQLTVRYRGDFGQSSETFITQINGERVPGVCGGGREVDCTDIYFNCFVNREITEEARNGTIVVEMDASSSVDFCTPTIASYK
eukprot:scaffold317369_cov21-Tisochrysis_lutea.AAC.1